MNLINNNSKKYRLLKFNIVYFSFHNLTALKEKNLQIYVCKLDELVPTFCMLVAYLF